MNVEEKQRIEQIRERLKRLERAEKDPHVKTWDGAYYGDVHFLLSLVKSQEAVVGIADDLPYRIVEEMGLGLTFRSCTCGQLPCARLRPLRNALEAVATSMRSACVEKVKALRAEWLELANKQPGWCQHVRAADSIITALESVSIQEQEKRPCGAPRPDDGSECLYSVCPRPRDGCSMYCWQHHGSQCTNRVQEQEVKQS